MKKYDHRDTQTQHHVVTPCHRDWIVPCRATHRLYRAVGEQEKWILVARTLLPSSDTNTRGTTLLALRETEELKAAAKLRDGDTIPAASILFDHIDHYDRIVSSNGSEGRTCQVPCNIHTFRLSRALSTKSPCGDSVSPERRTLHRRWMFTAALWSLFK